MSDFIRCPNCEEEGLVVPLSEGKVGLVCGLCSSEY